MGEAPSLSICEDLYSFKLGPYQQLRRFIPSLPLLSI